MLLMMFATLSISMAVIPDATEGRQFSIEPEKPVEDETIKISFLVMNNSMDPVFKIRLSFHNESFNAFPTLETEVNKTTTVILFTSYIKIGKTGEVILSEEHFDGSVWIEVGSFNITIEKKEKEDKNFLGLPDWYCSVGVILLTIGALFLTWSYFKGRKMQKREVLEYDQGFKCSDCGRPLKEEEDKCPWCGVEITGEEYICGKCKKIVKSDDRECPYCGAPLLLESDIPPPRGSLPGSKKMGDKKSRTIEIPDKGKKKCSNCGTVLLRSEKKCPICGKQE